MSGIVEFTFPECGDERVREAGERLKQFNIDLLQGFKLKHPYAAKLRDLLTVPDTKANIVGGFGGLPCVVDDCLGSFESQLVSFSYMGKKMQNDIRCVIRWYARELGAPAGSLLDRCVAAVNADQLE
jgi:hypothetical protein